MSEMPEPIERIAKDLGRSGRGRNRAEARLISAVPALTLAVIGVMGSAPDPTAAQSVADPSRLTGIDRVDVRTEAQWDELITMEAGGATPDQFLEALRMTFRDRITGADAAPSVVQGAPVTVACHVDTFYDTGLIVYSLRVQTERAGADGSPVITWIKSEVGSYTVQQLHLMFRLGEQCAESFLEDWRGANRSDGHRVDGPARPWLGRVVLRYAMMSWMTSPATSVSRKSRPL